MAIVLEGGYNLQAISHCYSACAATLLTAPVPARDTMIVSSESGHGVLDSVSAAADAGGSDFKPKPRPIAPRLPAQLKIGQGARWGSQQPETADVIRETIKAHKRYWTCLQ